MKSPTAIARGQRLIFCTHIHNCHCSGSGRLAALPWQWRRLETGFGCMLMYSSMLRGRYPVPTVLGTGTVAEYLLEYWPHCWLSLTRARSSPSVAGALACLLSLMWLASGCELDWLAGWLLLATGC